MPVVIFALKTNVFNPGHSENRISDSSCAQHIAFQMLIAANSRVLSVMRELRAVINPHFGR